MRSLETPCKTVCSVQPLQGRSKAWSFLLPIFLLANALLSDRFFNVREGSEVMDNTPTTSQKPEERFQKEKSGSFFKKSENNVISKFPSTPSGEFSLDFVVVTVGIFLVVYLFICI